MNKELISKEFKKIQDSICSSISELTSQKFSEDCWIYEKGTGGGRTRTLAGGIIEKGGVNFSSLSGQMSNKISKKINGKKMMLDALNKLFLKNKASKKIKDLEFFKLLENLKRLREATKVLPKGKESINFQ